MRVRVEFTTEPFHGEDGQLPAHVTASADALRAGGLAPDLGPLGTSVEGEADGVIDAVAGALKEALAHGATRVTLTLGDADAEAGVVTGTRTPANTTKPAGARTGGPADLAGATDLTDGLSRLITDVERELGGSLASLPRAEKQHAVRLLEERGAFEMRRSAETVAEALGLTRFTVYNYLNRIRDSAAEPAG